MPKKILIGLIFHGAIVRCEISYCKCTFLFKRNHGIFRVILSVVFKQFVCLCTITLLAEADAYCSSNIHSLSSRCLDHLQRQQTYDFQFNPMCEIQSSILQYQTRNTTNHFK